jgi:DNA-binding CsgD family transcriptional regulator
LPAVLPLTSRLRAQFKARFESLPARCRELLLLAALDGTGSIDLLLTAAGPDVVDGLAPAERARLILSERGGRLVFPHPLVAATVVTLSTEIERRHAHRALAAAYPDHGHHHAWHLAAGSVLPDESIAAMLDKSAHLTLRLGDAVGAITELTRAAELSPDRAHRGRRLAEAAYIDADVAGGLTHLPRLLGEDAVQDSGADRSLAAAIAQAYLRLNQDGDVLTAHRLLVAAIDGHRRRQSGPDTELVEALHALLFGSFFAGRDDLWAQFHVRLAEAGSAVPAALSIGASTFADPARASQAELASLDAMVADLRDETDPTVIVRCGMAAIYVDRLAGCRSALWRLVRDGRAGGAVTSAIDAMTLLCFDDLASGQWEHGQLLAAEALALCADNGYRLLEWPGLLATALLAAARGEGDLVTEVTARMRDWAAPRGVGIVQDYARQATALAAIGRGDFELAYRQASAISPPGRFAAHAPQALWVTLDLVESAVRTGRRDAALAHVAAMNATGIAAISSRLALTTAGCRAIAGADEDARVLYERALAVPGADRWPFEQARLQLCFGEFLRRQRDDAAARDQFAAALQTFQRLRATPWSARASRGARATGVPMRRPDGAAAVRLSPQQQQIATLAGSGLTNKEIAERMYLSHRTVGAHLYRLYPQLGVTSRAGLRDALAGIGSSTGADAGQAVR